MPDEPSPKPDSDFARRASQKRTGFVAELFGFLGHSRRYWLAPVVVLMVLLALLFVLASTGAAPFIYTLF